MTPSPWEIGAIGGGAAADTLKRRSDLSQLEDILKKAQQSQRQEQLDELLNQVITRVSPERQQQGAIAIQQRGNTLAQLGQQQRQRDYAVSQGLHPDTPIEGLKAFAQEKGKQSTGPQLSDVDKEYQKLQVKSVNELANNYLLNRESAEAFKFASATARKAIESNDISGPGFTAAAKLNPWFGHIVGLTPAESELEAANKSLLEGTKGIFGSKPTEREIFLLLNHMLPSIGKTKEANIRGLDYMDRVNEMKLMAGDIVDEITQGGTKYVPNLESIVSQRMKPYRDALLEDLKKETKGQEKTAKKASSPSDQLIEQARQSRKASGSDLIKKGQSFGFGPPGGFGGMQ